MTGTSGARSRRETITSVPRRVGQLERGHHHVDPAVGKVRERAEQVVGVVRACTLRARRGRPRRRGRTASGHARRSSAEAYPDRVGGRAPSSRPLSRARRGSTPATRGSPGSTGRPDRRPRPSRGSPGAGSSPNASAGARGPRARATGRNALPRCSATSAESSSARPSEHLAVRDHEAPDRLALDLVGDADHGGLGHGGVQRQDALDLGRAEALAGDVHRVVAAPVEEPLAVARRRSPSRRGTRRRGTGASRRPGSVRGRRGGRGSCSATAAGRRARRPRPAPPPSRPVGTPRRPSRAPGRAASRVRAG